MFVNTRRTLDIAVGTQLCKIARRSSPKLTLKLSLTLLVKNLSLIILALLYLKISKELSL